MSVLNNDCANRSCPYDGGSLPVCCTGKELEFEEAAKVEEMSLYEFTPSMKVRLESGVRDSAD